MKQGQLSTRYTTRLSDMPLAKLRRLLVRNATVEARHTAYIGIRHREESCLNGVGLEFNETACDFKDTF